MKRSATSTAVLAGLLIAMFATSTLAQEFISILPVVGSNPGITIAGVASGGAPWVVDHGVATFDDDGRLRVTVRGLILPSTGNTGPVTQVAASVVCVNVVVATSKSVDISTDGNFKIRDKVSIPSPCFGPVILIRVTGANGSPLPAPGPWIAASGTIPDADNK
jgi:hypothetical protein